MLRRSLHELAVGALLGGPRLVALLAGLPSSPLDCIARVRLDDGDAIDACRQAIAADLDARWPRSFRLNELESIAALVCPESFLKEPDLPMLDAVFAKLMQIDGDRICYQPAQVQAYMRLSAEIEPAVLVGWHLSGRLVSARPVAASAFEDWLEAQTPCFAPIGSPDQPVAENHAHLGGIFGDGPALARLVLELDDLALGRALKSPTLPEDQDLLARLRRVRGLLQALFERWLNGPSDNVTRALERASMLDPVTRLEAPTLHWPTLAKGMAIGLDVDLRRVLYQLAVSMSAGNLQQAWLVVFVGLWTTYRQGASSIRERMAVLAVIGELTILRRRLVMDGRGLRRFTERYYNPGIRKLARRSADSLAIDIARRIFVGTRDVAELKVGPGGYDPASVAVLAQAIDGMQADPLRGLLPSSNDPQTALFRATRRATLDRWHYCIHFSRSGRCSVTQRRAELWDEAIGIARTTGDVSRWLAARLLGGGESRVHEVHPAHFLRGLDVAGDETGWPIEVFAPMLRWLRTVRLDHEDDTSLRSPRPHFSIHAGEDYSHPLSGMRHVDETVRFCEMTDGDRLGHALAIGIDPQDWFAQHGQALVDVDEHLDNLVWAWHCSTQLADRLAIAARVRPNLEARIARFMPHATWWAADGGGDNDLPGPDATGLTPARLPTPAELHEAWWLRRNCPQRLAREDPRMPVLDDLLVAGVPDHERLLAEIQHPGRDIPAALFLARASRERRRRRPCGTKVLVNAAVTEASYREALEGPQPEATALLHDHEEPEQIEFMHSIQDLLLDNCSRGGIGIEANPTSNVYIGGLDQYNQHLLFRWNPPDPADLRRGEHANLHGLRSGAIAVTINTDDQGIMPTTMRTELALIRQAAIDREVPAGQAEAWIEAMRECGLREFERNHLGIFSNGQSVP